MSDARSETRPPSPTAPIDRALWVRVGVGLLAGVALLLMVAAAEYVSGSFDRGTIRGGDGRPYPLEPYLRTLAIALPSAGGLVGLALPLFRSKLGAVLVALLALLPFALTALPRLLEHGSRFQFWQAAAALAAFAVIAAIIAIGVRPAVLGTGQAEFPVSEHVPDLP